jgi:tRNA pseudouridine55 synthase
MVSMETIENLSKQGEEGDAALDQLLVPVDGALEHLAEVNLTEEMAYQLCLGQAVSVPQAPTEGLVRIYDHKHTFIGIGTILDDGRVAPKRLLKTNN